MGTSKKITRVLSGRFDRLGARLASIVRGIELAKVYGCDFHFFWEENPLFPEETNNVHKVFSSAFIEKHYINDRSSWGNFIINDSIYERIGEDTEYLVSCPFLDPEREWAETTGDLLSGLGIEFHENIQRPLSELAKQYGNRIGLHIRRGDVVSGINAGMFEYRNRYIPIEFYNEYIRNSSNESFLVFSDDFELTSGAFPSGADVICFNETNEARLIRGIQRDLLELLLMARMKETVGGHSAFRSIAASFHNRPTNNIQDILDDGTQRRLLEFKITSLPEESVELIPCIFKLCDHLEVAGDIELLESYFGLLNKRFYSNPKFLNHVGHALWRAGKMELADKYFKDSQAVLNNDVSFCGFGRARVASSMGEHSRAVDHAVNAAIYGRFRSAKIVLFALTLLNKTGQFERSAELYDGIFTVHQDHPDINYHMSVSFNGIEDLDRALKLAKAASKKRPDKKLYSEWVKRLEASEKPQ